MAMRMHPLTYLNGFLRYIGYYRYDPAVLLPAMQGKENSLLEVRVASTYLTYDNAKVKKRELWGTDIYTDDSDVVASKFQYR